METPEPPTRPDHQPLPTRKPPALVVMVGPPGTGKSFLARRVAERVPVRIVETDEIRQQVASRPSYSADEHRRVFHLAHRKIDRLLRQGKNVIFDATNIYEHGRRTLYRIAESDGARLLVVRTVAPDQVVAERMHARGLGLSGQDRSEADWDIYARMKAEFEQIERPHLVVDTSRDLLPAVEEIVRFVQDRE